MEQDVLEAAHVTTTTAPSRVAPAGKGDGVAVHAWRDARWAPMVLGNDPLPGFHWWPLQGDEQGQWEAYWMRVDAGAQSPLHQHPATELLHIHEGVLIDEDGRAYGAGDVVVFAAGSRHFTRSPSGCHALVVTSRQAAVLDDALRRQT